MEQNKLESPICPSSLLKFAFPTIIMMLFTSIYSIVDGIFISRILGTDAFSALNIVYPVFGIVVAVGAMFGSGVSALIARKLGQGHMKEARQDISFILYFSVALGILLSVIGYLFLPQLIYLLGADDSIFHYCYDYSFVLIFFLPVYLLQLEFQSLFVANGTPRLGLITTVAGGIINIILDYVFMAVMGMGVEGAAIATSIGVSVPAVFGILYFVFHRKGNLYLVKPKRNKNTLLRSMTNGSSEMVSNMSGAVTNFLFNIIMMRITGPDGVAAIGIILYIDFVAIAISLGYAMGVAPLISYNYGKGDHDNLKKLYRMSSFFNFLIGCIICIMTILFANPLVSIFAASDGATYLFAVTGLRIFGVSYLLKGYNIFVSSMFTAFSNGKVSALLSFGRTIVFTITCTLLFTALIGVNGICLGICVAEFLSFLSSLFFTKHYKKIYNFG